MKAIVEYKCRRCGEWFATDSLLVDVVLSPTGVVSTNSGITIMFYRTHDCSSMSNAGDGIGLADCVGWKEVEDEGAGGENA